MYVYKLIRHLYLKRGTNHKSDLSQDQDTIDTIR